MQTLLFLGLWMFTVGLFFVYVPRIIVSRVVIILKQELIQREERLSDLKSFLNRAIMTNETLFDTDDAEEIAESLLAKYGNDEEFDNDINE